jgi:phosphoserine phosphatase RsbU/P
VLETPVPAAEEEAVCRSHQPPRILVVDDDQTTARVLAGILGGAGFEILLAHDLAAAEAVIGAQPLSLMLLDVHLPDGNGLDFCEQLMTRPSLAGLPVLFISANDDVAAKVRGFGAGAVDYITKPLAGAEVLARVRTHLRLRAANDSLVALQAERIQLLAASQQSLMPQPADLPEANFQVCMRQAQQAGGDFYDVVSSGHQINDFIVADASGHDLGVSLWTASFKTLLAEYATVVFDPLDICRMINRSLRRVLPEGSFFTALYARLNRSTRRLQLVNAGNPPALLLTPATGELRVLQQAGDIIGIFADAVFDVLEIPVQTADRLFLYSDGLVEMGTNRDTGLARLAAACRATAGLPLAAAVPAIVDEICIDQTITDDIVLLGVEV